MPGKERRERRVRTPYSNSPLGVSPDRVITSNETTVPLLQQLTDNSGKVRKKACNLLALASCDPSSSSLIIRNGGVKKLIQCVGDNNYPVVASALLALRNLTLSGDSSVIVELSQINNLRLFLIPFAKSKELLNNKSEKETATKIICHTLGIYWNLVIENESIVDFILNNNILNDIISFLNISHFDNEIITTAAHILAAITDEHEKAIQSVRQFPNISENLVQIIQYKPIQSSNCMPIIPIICSAILFNIRDRNNSLPIINILFPALSFSLCELSPNEIILKELQQIKENESIAKDIEFVKEVEYTKNSVEAQIATLELLTNICGMEEWDNTMNETDSFSNIPEEIHQLFLHIPISKILQMCQTPKSELQTQLDKNPAIYSELTDFLKDRSIRAFSCLSNIFGVFNPSEFGNITSIWNELGVLFTKIVQCTDNIVYLEGVTSVMRSIICNNDDLGFLQQNDINGIITLCNNVLSPEIRRCGITMITSITMKQEYSKYSDLYKQTGNILIQKLGDESIIVLNEAINGIFDLFGKDETKQLCKEANILTLLLQFNITLKSRIQQQSSIIDEELLEILQGTQDNLEGFIEYLKE